MNREIYDQIQEKLSEIERTENVTVLHAVESGSRAWGVESPDSDYDVRFIYVRPKEDYLRLRETRDVIEWQLDDVLDINGWDLNKTLIQFHKGNATLFEWANSPVVYRTTSQWQEIYACAKGYFSEKAALHHYRGTAAATWKQYLRGETVRYKKYIYALRPLLACRYIETSHTLPPVRFDELLKQPLPAELLAEIDKMLRIKEQSGEKDEHPHLPGIQQYIEGEINRLSDRLAAMPQTGREEWEPLEALFLRILG